MFQTFGIVAWPTVNGGQRRHKSTVDARAFLGFRGILRDIYTNEALTPMKLKCLQLNVEAWSSNMRCRTKPDDQLISSLYLRISLEFFSCEEIVMD